MHHETFPALPTKNDAAWLRYLPPSEGRLGVNKAILFGQDQDQLGLG